MGALTVKVVALRGEERVARVALHQGRPRAVLHELLREPEFVDAKYYEVCGPLGDLSEVTALQRAFLELDPEFEAVISLGGESFLAYLLAGRRIVNVLSHNQCAAGSGEFLVQQVRRMGFNLEEAIQRSFAGRVVPLASRCSVHCKSDITHKLNRHEASAEDLLRTLHDSMANKAVALLEQSQRELRRVLLIGGVTRNVAMLAALREKAPGTEFRVLPESPWFEAWGSALLARDRPVHPSPRIAMRPSLGQLPPLARYAERVRILPAPARRVAPAGAWVLGVDAGSTTTKVALIDLATRGLVASHYARTQTDPVAATRRCLAALADQVGNPRIALVATTGSARELVGAYLGTEHVYNEISAQAAGANHFDAGVDTLFEIGGQDAKYIRLHHGVPVDYAMNNACSAGTGSFLEESAQGDLGIAVSDIADLALAAPSPVQFRTTCAAFINSDIRLAQQEGQARDDIVAGLVYAIAANYLTKVKGPRPVGERVFLQGGVALNRAVGHAFAHRLSRTVVIPPHPELLGAIGVALLAADRSVAAHPSPSDSRRDDASCPPSENRSRSEPSDGDGAPSNARSLASASAPAAPGGSHAPGPERELLSLAAPEMKRVGRFVCRACTMYCSVDRFEVGGRRFPFGGRCSLFEHRWKRTAPVAAAPDLVAQRTRILFGSGTAGGPRGGPRLGLPRALTTHSLYPLYATFFAGLGLDVVLSEVDPRGDLKSYSGFCLPAQIAHGAVLDLARAGVDWVFLPHVTRMPQPNDCRDSYLCPVTQAGPYFLPKAFPGIRFLSPLLDFTAGYAATPALVEMAVRELGTRRAVAEEAWQAAVRAQLEAERALRELGREALERAVADASPAILLAGHSYNAFTPEASQSVGKKLASMGVLVIPADCLAPGGEGLTAWHFANQILNAVALVRQHPNLFLVCVSNFSCTIDAFTHATIGSELGAKPYLILEIDAHTADAGVQTRLEAFLDIVRHYRAAQAGRARDFPRSRLTTGGRVIRSNGEPVPITDPRVRIVLPNFSQAHTQALTMVARWLGLHPGEAMPLERRQLERGLEFTSGRECLPLPICLGQLLQAVEARRPGEVVGFFMVHGGAPCVVDAYLRYFERFIAEQELADVFLFDPRPENEFGGVEPSRLTRDLAAAIPVADILVEIEHVLSVVGAEGSPGQLRQRWEQFTRVTASLDEFNATLPEFIDWLAALPRARDPMSCPRVAVTGDFFTRFSPFFMEGIAELYAARGIILKPVDLSELVLYTAYHELARTALAWGLKPGGRALAKACTRIFQPDGKQYLQRWLGYLVEQRTDVHYRNLFRRTGLLVAGPNDVPEIFEQAAQHVSPAIFGEAIPTVGKGLRAASEGYAGIILIGPFNCLPYRISEAILKPLSAQAGMPILTHESDGYPVAPSFRRQVEVHIQQVLERAGQTRELPRTTAGGPAGRFRSVFGRRG